MLPLLRAGRDPGELGVAAAVAVAPSMWLRPVEQRFEENCFLDLDVAELFANYRSYEL